MKAPQPHPGRLAAHSQGDGPVVLCLHSSTGTHAQWNGLADALSGRWQVVAPDLHGHGRSPAWPTAVLNTLHVDANAVTQLVQPAWGLVRRGIHLVGHSYGAAVAMQIALRHPQWVRSLTLYEPVAVGIVRRLAPQDAALDEVREIASRVAGLAENSTRPAVSRSMRCNGTRSGLPSRRTSRASSVSRTNPPAGVTGKKCGLSATTRCASTCSTVSSNGIVGSSMTSRK
jgi:pimeloyl-ACP methyl ester carboxylesterase